MTREEEIDKIASAFAIDEVRDTCNPASKRGLLYVGFITGAEWADAHPDIDVRTMAAWQSGYNEGIDKFRWLSVEDKLPKDDVYVATINKNGFQEVRHYSHGKWYSNFGNEYDGITHWMPLPEAPKKGGE